MRGAAGGGITWLACPPDTDPPLDEPGLVEMLTRRASGLGARVHPLGALTVGLGREARRDGAPRRRRLQGLLARQRGASRDGHALERVQVRRDLRIYRVAAAAGCR